MIHHPSQCAYERHPPLDVCHFEYYQGVNASHKAHWLHGVSILMTNYGYAKIIGKPRRPASVSLYSVPLFSKLHAHAAFDSLGVRQHSCDSNF